MSTQMHKLLEIKANVPVLNEKLKQPKLSLILLGSNAMQQGCVIGESNSQRPKVKSHFARIQSFRIA